MEVDGCGCFTHNFAMVGRPCFLHRWGFSFATGRGSPPLFLEKSMNKISSQIQRTGYITINVRSVIGNDGTKPFE